VCGDGRFRRGLPGWGIVDCHWAHRPLHRGRSKGIAAAFIGGRNAPAGRRVATRRDDHFISIDVCRPQQTRRKTIRMSESRVRRTAAHFLSRSRSSWDPFLRGLRHAETEDAACGFRPGPEPVGRCGVGAVRSSAYAREGARCRHNLNYGLFGDTSASRRRERQARSSFRNASGAPSNPRQPREYSGAVRRTGLVLAPAPRIGRRASARALCLPKNLPFAFMLNALRLNAGSIGIARRTGEMGSVKASLAGGEARGSREQGGRWLPRRLGRRLLNDLKASFRIAFLCTPECGPRTRYQRRVPTAIAPESR